MQGWSEEEITDRRLMAPCGLYCGVCGVYISTRDDSEKFRARLGELYGTPAEETRCYGCMQPDPPALLYAYCRSCPVRECVLGRASGRAPPAGVALRADQGLPLATGRRVMLRTIPSGGSKWSGTGRSWGAWSGPGRVRALSLPGLRRALFRGASAAGPAARRWPRTSTARSDRVGGASRPGRPQPPTGTPATSAATSMPLPARASASWAECRPDGEGPVVDGHHGPDAQQARGAGGLGRIHGVVAADGEEGHLRCPQLPDQRHVPEDHRVAGVVEDRPPGEGEHPSRRLPAVSDAPSSSMLPSGPHPPWSPAPRRAGDGAALFRPTTWLARVG